MDMSPVLTTFFTLQGGLNLVSPPLNISEGMCRDALNFDADVDGGYRWIAGYERYDGKKEPSTATYSTVYCTFPPSATGVVSVGVQIVGATSGATGTAIEKGTNYIAFTKGTGTFQAGENITVSGNIAAVASAISNQGGAPTSLLNSKYKHLAANVYRNDILQPSGSGAILGVWYFQNAVYAFRNNASSTAADMFIETPTGWQKVNLNYEVNFSNANTSVQAGDTLTQGGITATILKVVVESGSLASGTNTGKLIITQPSSSYSIGTATSTGSGALTLTSNSIAITLPPNGKYTFVNYNFGGFTDSLKMYGANGVGRAFEFDGSIFVPIKTGMPVDSPKYIAAHANRLFLTFDSSLQFSSVGVPYVFDVVVGAGEIAMGDSITSIQPLVGSDSTSALAVFSKNRTSILYGTSSSDFNLVVYSHESGAFPYTAQSIGQLYLLDELGVRQMAATQSFGNFQSAQITKYIKPWLKNRSGLAVCSTFSRLKNQYRIYFSDKSGLHITVDNDKVVGVMPVQTVHAFNCMCSVETGDGDEIILAGGTSGYVYRWERGTSFDGEDINGFLILSFNHTKSPRGRKRYRKAVYEITGNDYSEFQAGYELGYGSSEISQGVNQTLSTPFGNVYWDGFFWDNFYWDGKTLLPVEQGLTGTAENISLSVRATTAYNSSFTINSVILHFSPRRNLR